MSQIPWINTRVWFCNRWRKLFDSSSLSEYGADKSSSQAPPLGPASRDSKFDAVIVRSGVKTWHKCNLSLQMNYLKYQVKLWIIEVKRWLWFVINSINIKPTGSSTVLPILCLQLARRPHPLQHGQRGEGDSAAGRRHQDVRLQPGQGHLVRFLLCFFFGKMFSKYNLSNGQSPTLVELNARANTQK